MHEKDLPPAPLLCFHVSLEHFCGDLALQRSAKPALGTMERLPLFTELLHLTFSSKGYQLWRLLLGEASFIVAFTSHSFPRAHLPQNNIITDRLLPTRTGAQDVNCIADTVVHRAGRRGGGRCGGRLLLGPVIR